MTVRTRSKTGLDVEYPAVVPLLNEDDDGFEQIVGWLFVLDCEVVSYLPAMSGRGHAIGVFRSVASAARVLSYTGIWFSPTSDSDLAEASDGSWR